MKAFFWAILSCLILGLLARIDIGGGGILVTDILLPLFCFVWAGKKIIANEKFPNIPWIKAGFVFVLLAFLSWWWGVMHLDVKSSLVSMAYGLRLLTFLGFGCAALDIFQNAQRQKKSADFFTPFFWIVAVVVGLGFLQFYLVPDISTYSTEGGWDPHIGRLLGTWLDPNYLAGFLGFVLPLMVAVWYNEKKFRGKFWLGILILATFAALFLTFSRSGYLAAGLGLIFFFAWKDPKVILIGAGVVILGITFNERAQQRIGELAGTMASILLQDTDEIDPTASLRIQNWGKSFDLFKKYPFTGVGYNTYRYRAAEEGIVDENYFSAGGADSTHLTVLVTTGVFGFWAYLYWLWRMFSTHFGLFWKQRKNPKRWLQLAYCAGGISLFVHASFVNSLFFPLIFLVVMAVGGILLVKDKS